MLNQLPQIIIPARDPLPELVILQQENWGKLEPWLPWMHAGIQLAVLGLLFLLGRKLWQFAQRHPPSEPLLKTSPILPIIAIYIALYVFAQPFVSFNPMDYRDSTTLLCLVQPYLIALLIRLLHRKAIPILSTYVAVNLLMIIVPVSLYGIPDVISPSPFHVNDLARNFEEIDFYIEHGIPEWLLITQSRTRFIERHHPQIKTFFRKTNPEIAIVSSIPLLLFFDEQREYLPAISMRTKYRDIDDWLELGYCKSQYATFLLLDSGINGVHLHWVTQKIAQKCPEMEAFVIDNMLVYRLGHQE
jgi:hypothetical protein